MIETLARPDAVKVDATNQSRRCYYKMGAIGSPYDGYYLKVVVEFDLQEGRIVGPGMVVTAYTSTRVSSGEAHEWR